MYDLIDRAVADLPNFERVLLDETRRWVHALTLAGAGAATPMGFARDERAAVAFDTLMRALDRGSSETLVFQRPCHSTVAETEAVMLGIWRLVRADRIVAARQAIAALVDPAEARDIVGGMMRVVSTGIADAD